MGRQGRARYVTGILSASRLTDDKIIVTYDEKFHNNVSA